MKEIRDKLLSYNIDSKPLINNINNNINNKIDISSNIGSDDNNDNLNFNIKNESDFEDISIKNIVKRNYSF